MPEPQAPVPPRHDNPEVAHEYSDVNVRAILGFGAGLALLALVVHLGLWWLHRHFQTREEAAQAPLPPPAAELRPRLPHGVTKIPEPRLQIFEPQNLRRQRAEEAARLASYGWVDQKSGVVHISIDRAMELLARPGALPARPPKEGP